MREENASVKDGELMSAFGVFLDFCGMTGILHGNINWMKRGI